MGKKAEKIIRKPKLAPHGGEEDAEAIKVRLEHFKKWLMQFDTDHDGRINWRELREAIRRRGAWFAGLKAWFALQLADKDGNGLIDDDEIKHLMDLAEKDLAFNKTCCYKINTPL